MPHVVQPRDGGGKMGVHYTTCWKRGLVATSKRMQAEGMSLRAAASKLRVSIANLLKWASQGGGKEHMDKIHRSKKKVALTGPVSQLKAIKNALLRYIFKLREQGITGSTFMVMLRALFILPEFCERASQRAAAV